MGLLFEVQPLVKANYYYPRPWGPYIVFNSPTNNSYEGGAGFTPTLEISVGTMTRAQAPGESYELTYSLDGQPYKTLPTVYEGIFEDQNTMPHSVNSGRTSLPSLSEGNHTITAHCILEVDNSIFTADDRVIFNIDNTPPQILILTLENKTYHTNDLPLNFTVNEPSYLAYRLDGKEVQIEGNTTLIGLTSGSHSFNVIANDRAGNTGNSETIFFRVIEPETFLIAAITVIIVIILTVAVTSTLLYKRHQKSKIS
jgi:hypothetical protein